MASFRHPPEFLLDATRFQQDTHTFNPLWVITTLRRFEGQPHDLLAPLTAAIEHVQRQAGTRFGRRRGQARFELAYLAFVFSRHPDVRPWWQSAGRSIWKAIGLKERPSYEIVQRRFAELEDPAVIAAIEEIARTLIQLAVAHSEGRVGRYLHVDSTEAETHARLQHVCPETSPCWLTARGEKRKRPRPRRLSASAATKAVRARRHLDAAEPEPERTHLELGDGDELRYADDRLRLRVGGCWYEILDPTAGVRAYIEKRRVRRFWVGFYNAKAIDHFTGSPVAVLLTSASVQEHASYPRLYQAATTNTGCQPVAVIADRGYSISSVFEHNTRLGVGSVMPWRATASRTDRADEDCDTHDRHGVVRCKHCGGPTRFASFSRTAGSMRTNGKKRGPRLYVYCVAPLTPECERRQSIGCETSWRMLLPLWRDTPLYLALRHSHDRYERVHHHWRVRWRSGADEHALRPKRRGIHNQQLRANAALLIEWLMICWREGWLPGQPILPLDPERVIEEDGSDYAKGLAQRRAELGLDKPYGPKAQTMKIGTLTPRATVTPVEDDDPSDPEHQSQFDLGIVEPDQPPTSDPGVTIKNAAEVDPEQDDLPF